MMQDFKGSNIFDTYFGFTSSVNSSFEFWKEGCTNINPASNSNINDAVNLTESGLTKIPKEAIYSM